MTVATYLALSLALRTDAQQVLDRMEANLRKANTVEVQATSSAMGETRTETFLLMRGGYIVDRERDRETYVNPTTVCTTFPKAKTYMTMPTPEGGRPWLPHGFESFVPGNKLLKATGKMEVHKSGKREMLEIEVGPETLEAMLVDRQTYLPAGFVTPTAQARFTTYYTVKLNGPSKEDFQWKPPAGWQRVAKPGS